MTSGNTPETDSETFATLCPADAAVLDAYMAQRAAGLELGQGPMPVGSAARAEKLNDVLTLLDCVGVGEDPAEAAPASLTANTMQAIHDATQRERFASQVDMAHAPRTFGVSLRQVAAAIAICLIAMSLLLPMMSRTKKAAIQTNCLDGLREAGQGLATYAVQHNDGLPQLTSSRATASASNSTHLFLLIREGYVTADTLTCPGHEAVSSQTLDGRPMMKDWAHANEVSYSYVNQIGLDEPMRLIEHSRMAVLADRNPRYQEHADGSITEDLGISAQTASRNHGGKGQNVLFTDGSVTWTQAPVVQRPDGELDNIWTRDLPDRAADNDSYLVP